MNTVDLETLRPGAQVLGVDYEIGTLESVDRGGSEGSAQLIVRHGHADYLLAIPAEKVEEASATRIQLDLRREDAERLLYDSGDAGPTIPTPLPDTVLGKHQAEPPDGPGTG